MTRKKINVFLICFPLLAACLPYNTSELAPTVLPPATPTHTITVQAGASHTATATPMLAPSSATPIPTMEPRRSEEAIFIRQPASGSRVTSPIHIAGIADSTFEQNLVVRVVDVDGEELFLAPTTIQADIGERGLFELDVSLDLAAETNFFIQVYATSPRDGGITHLASTGVIFSPGGTQDVIVREPQPEQITIYQPGIGDTITGGEAHVEGFALASFEQTLVIEIIDTNGENVGSQPVIVQAPDLGQPGHYSADVHYSVSELGPGRVIVRDISPAFGGDTHRGSVEVSLEP